MADHLSIEKRSWNMSRIRSNNTKPELLVRKSLFKLGYRYRIKNKLPGKPDIVLKKYKTAVFINGCFWHRCKKCKRATIPKTNTKYWLNKFDQNVKRDIQNYKELEKMGWKVIIIWECEVKNKEFLDQTIENIISKL